MDDSDVSQNDSWNCISMVSTDDLQHKISNLHTKLEQSEQTVLHLQNDNCQMKDEIQQLLDERFSYEQKLKQLQEEIEKSKNDLKAKYEENLILQDKCFSIEKELNDHVKAEKKRESKNVQIQKEKEQSKNDMKVKVNAEQECHDECIPYKRKQNDYTMAERTRELKNDQEQKEKEQLKKYTKAKDTVKQKPHDECISNKLNDDAKAEISQKTKIDHIEKEIKQQQQQLHRSVSRQEHVTVSDRNKNTPNKDQVKTDFTPMAEGFSITKDIKNCISTTKDDELYQEGKQFDTSCHIIDDTDDQSSDTFCENCGIKNLTRKLSTCTHELCKTCLVEMSRKTQKNGMVTCICTHCSVKTSFDEVLILSEELYVATNCLS